MTANLEAGTSQMPAATEQRDAAQLSEYRGKTPDREEVKSRVANRIQSDRRYSKEQSNTK